MSGGIYKKIERYAPEIRVISAQCPNGRSERGFIQPLSQSSDELVSPSEPGRGGGKYLLIASAQTITAEETDVSICWCGRDFALVNRELVGINDLVHIECLLRGVGRCHHD